MAWRGGRRRIQCPCPDDDPFTGVPWRMPRAPGVAEPNDEGAAFFSDPAGKRIGLMKAM